MKNLFDIAGTAAVRYTVQSRGLVLLRGAETRPWLLEWSPCRKYGNESRNRRGRVRVNLGKPHRFSNSAGWAYRYRLVAAYALDRRLEPNEHVDHINGFVDDDRIGNLRVVTAELHGAYHARLFDLAGCRGPDGRFIEAPLSQSENACRLGPIISTRPIDPETWIPLSCVLAERREIA